VIPPQPAESIDNILSALYAAISGPAGARDWTHFRSLFAPGARLISTAKRNDGSIALDVLDVEGFITRASAAIANKSFYEREIARRIERYGAIAHVFSTYESRQNPTDPPFDRGINSIQLFFDGIRWWVVTIYWTNELSGSAIPAPYLPLG
jgi:hypothetical protein